jgi:hypothetical protein
MSKNMLFIAVLFIIFASKLVQAQEVHNFYYGVRGLGMGGAQIAVVNDETALLVNPANLSKLRDYFGTIFDPELDASDRLNNIYTSAPFTGPYDLVEVSNSLNKNKGTYFHHRSQVFPSFVVRNFGIGLLYKQQVDMVMNAAGTQINTYYTQDEGLFLGYSFRLFDGRIKIGFLGKAFDRVQVIDATKAYPGSYNLQAIASEGAAVGGDVGLTLSAPWTYIPTLSVVARDVGDTQFTAGKNVVMTTTGTPTRITQDYDVALAIFPNISNNVRTTWTIEAQNVLVAQTAVDPYRYLHAGWELNYKDIIMMRLGMNGHWWTAGFELNASSLQFQFATYGQDVGTGTNITEDRRFTGKLAYRF